MDSKLQELTDKVYNEGVERGRAEAKAITDKASQEAAQIIARAKAEAEQITAQARKAAQELDGNTRSELRLFAGQAVNSLRSDITNLVTDRVASAAVAEATKDPDFMPSIIRTIAKAWAKEGSVTIETADADRLTAYFRANAAELLKNGVVIRSSKNNASFTIAPEKGGFKVTIGEAELVEYFKEFMRPKLVEMLF